MYPYLLINLVLFVFLFEAPNQLHMAANIENEVLSDQPGDSLYCYYLRLTAAYQDPEKWTPDTQQTIKNHAAWLDSLGKAGILILAGRTDFSPGDPRLFGIALVKAPDLHTAQAILKEDPAVIAGIQQANIYPFSMGIRYFENFN